MRSLIRILPVVALLAIVLFAVYKFFPDGSDDQSRLIGECRAPADPFFGTEGQIELALNRSIGVFKFEAEPRMLDAIPKEARTLEMVGFLTCMAKQQGLIKSSEDFEDYKEFLRSFSQGERLPTARIEDQQLGQFRRDLQQLPSVDFALHLEPPDELEAFQVAGDFKARSFRALIQKICANYKCLECSFSEQEAEIRAVGHIESAPGGSSCAR
jgi:hypothetical protein